jgi:TolB protein
MVRPTWHPTTNELILVHYVVSAGHEDSDILTTRKGLVETAPLLTQTGNQDYPHVSPNGRLLAYTSAHTISLHRGAVQVVQQLWAMDLTTGVAQQLVAGNAQDIHPRWSPSGRALAFASNRSGQFEIWVVNTDGSGLQQVTSGPGAKTWPAWSPDGKSIMFTLMQDGHQRLWIIDVDGFNLRPFEPFGPGADVELRDADWR